jgi:hypothetical protein
MWEAGKFLCAVITEIKVQLRKKKMKRKKGATYFRPIFFISESKIINAQCFAGLISRVGRFTVHCGVDIFA